MLDGTRRLLRALREPIYNVTLWILFPLNWLLSIIMRPVKYKRSVLHISYMVHIPYYTVQILREMGMKADYLAIGNRTNWDKFDYHLTTSRWPFIQALQEFVFFWMIESRYETIHSHFMITMSPSGWELQFLKRLGRKIVIHYRGCEIRERERNIRLHPDMNICQICDYDASICTNPLTLKRRRLSKMYGDHFLVTTPDLNDFVPEAEHLPFFSPSKDLQKMVPRKHKLARDSTTKIIHVTNHPGIEGTHHINQAIDNLKARGFSIKFNHLSGVSYEDVINAYQDADLAIGKMKMGYYANVQIESMYYGVPTITYVRPEFQTQELKESGLIFTTIDELEQTLEYYLTHPEELEKIRQIAHTSIMRLHDNHRIGTRLVQIYEHLHNA